MTDAPDTNKPNSNFKLGSAMERINKVTGLNTLSKFGATGKLIEKVHQFSKLGEVTKIAEIGNTVQQLKEKQTEINKPIVKQNLEAEEKIIQVIEANKEKHRDRKRALELQEMQIKALQKHQEISQEQSEENKKNAEESAAQAKNAQKIAIISAIIGAISAIIGVISVVIA